jgi:hypothetical protein
MHLFTFLVIFWDKICLGMRKQVIWKDWKPEREDILGREGVGGGGRDSE